MVLLKNIFLALLVFAAYAVADSSALSDVSGCADGTVISAISIEGLEHTNPRVVERELLNRAGEPFSAEKFEAEKTSTYVIIPEDQHCTDKNASVKIEYSPIYDEVRIYYETLYVTYDRGEAMNTVMAVLQDFQKENKYYSYKYLKPESHKHFRDDRGQRKEKRDKCI